MIFVAFGSVDVDLCRKIAACIHFVVHVQRRILAVTQIVGSVGQIYTFGYTFFVVASGVNVLSFFCMTDGCACILTEWQCSFGCHFCIAQHREGYEFVVFAGFGIGENFGYHGIVFATQHESIVVGGLAGQYGECLRVYDQKFVAAPVFNFYIV